MSFITRLAHTLYTALPATELANLQGYEFMNFKILSSCFHTIRILICYKIHVRFRVVDA